MRLFFFFGLRRSLCFQWAAACGAAVCLGAGLTACVGAESAGVSKQQSPTAQDVISEAWWCESYHWESTPAGGEITATTSVSQAAFDGTSPSPFVPHGISVLRTEVYGANEGQLSRPQATPIGMRIDVHGIRVAGLAEKDAAAFATEVERVKAEQGLVDSLPRATARAIAKQLDLRPLYLDDWRGGKAFRRLWSRRLAATAPEYRRSHEFLFTTLGVVADLALDSAQADGASRVWKPATDDCPRWRRWWERVQQKPVCRALKNEAYLDGFPPRNEGREPYRLTLDDGGFGRSGGGDLQLSGAHLPQLKDADFAAATDALAAARSAAPREIFFELLALPGRYSGLGDGLLNKTKENSSLATVGLRLAGCRLQSLQLTTPPPTAP